MYNAAPPLVRRILAVATVSLLVACSGDVPAPLVWQAREVVVLPIDGGRQVESLWVRKGVALVARHRTDARVAMGDIAIDRERAIVWVRDGASLKALTFPELELFAQRAVGEGGGGPLTLGADGIVSLGESRYVLAGQVLEPLPVRSARHPSQATPRS
ncbi:MAG: hypothetical protein KDH20_06260 [Rhodocyclaceae bacterium]|nr:hypothetical protein [Rhodocyclaceae bacterium]